MGILLIFHIWGFRGRVEVHKVRVDSTPSAAYPTPFATFRNWKVQNI